MMYDDKTMALATFLNVDPATISNNYSDYFTVNERKVLRGTSPEEYKQQIKDFKSLLTRGLKGSITRVAKRGATVEGRKKLYDKVSAHLETVDHESEEYKRLQKAYLHVVNLPYNFLLGPSYGLDSRDSIREAWLGTKIVDRRRQATEDDGEYLVLTDSEADAWEKEGLEQLFDDMTHDVPSGLSSYLDSDRFVDEHSGNRGENINGYDGSEEEQEYNGVTYYIYRNN